MGEEENKELLADDSRKILIVDDEDQIRDMFKLFVETDIPGLHVDTACNGVEAVKMFLEGRHDILLMDLHMPIMDGTEAFREIEDICDTMDWEVPIIIFCTAYDPPCDANNIVKNHKYAESLRKPISNDALIAAVKRALASKG